MYMYVYADLIYRYLFVVVVAVYFFAFFSVLHRPDMTFAVDWALNNNCLLFYIIIVAYLKPKVNRALLEDFLWVLVNADEIHGASIAASLLFTG